MDHNGTGFLYLKRKFPKISDANMKELIKDLVFEEKYGDLEKTAWKSFKNVTE